MKRLLITGATGFIGYHLVEKAVASGFEVYATMRNSSSTEHLKSFNIKFVAVNLADSAALALLIKENKIDYIIHNAGLTKALHPDEFQRVNVQCTQSLIDAVVASEVQLKKFIFISSMAASGPSQIYEQVISVDDLDQPVSFYGKSKLAAEFIVKQNLQLPYIIFRPTAVYGPWEKDILVMIKSIKAGFDVHIGKFEQALTFIYSKDLADLVISSLGSDISRSTYLVSDGNIYDRYSFSNAVISSLGNKPLRLHLPIIIGQMVALVNEWISKVNRKPPLFDRDKLPELTASSWRIDTQTLYKDFNFIPKFDLKAGITDAVEWYKKNKWL